VAEGKIRNYGVSVERIEEALKAMEYPGVVSVQIIFNIFRQRPAESFFDIARTKNVAIIARVPLASGLLSGKFRADTTFEATDHRQFNRHGESFDVGETFSGVPYEVGLAAVERIRPLVAGDATMAKFALRWILMFDAVSCAIPGGKRPEQVRENCAVSDLPALSQGMTLGAILQGIAVENRAYAGSWWDWLTPYTLLTGLGTVAGYCLLGATWLVWKLDGPAQDHAYRVARLAAIATLALLVAVSLYTPLLDAEYWRRWFEAPGIYFASQVPLLTAIVTFTLFYGLAKRWELAPFLLSLALFLLGMLGLGVSMWPYIVPDQVTIWDAAAPERSQAFMLVGVGLTLPLIIGYTGWAYWVFRGKVGHEGYH